MSWSKNVYSSHVTEVGYDHETGELVVKWDTGKTSAYAGVPESVAHQAAHADSVGSFLTEEIKPNYKHRYR